MKEIKTILNLNTDKIEEFFSIIGEMYDLLPEEKKDIGQECIYKIRKLLKLTRD